MTARKPPARTRATARATSERLSPEDRRQLRALVNMASETRDSTAIRDYAMTKGNLPSESTAHAIAEWVMGQLRTQSRSRRRVHGAITTIAGLVELLGP